MIKFVIVEDEVKFKDRFENIIKVLMMNNDSEYLVETYDSFNDSLKNTLYDDSIKKVYIMDIEVNGPVSGLEIAKMIRKTDWDSEIIFVTSHDKMFETVYRSIFKIFDFIEKFHSLDERLEFDLKCIIQMSFDTKKFSYKNQRIDVQIYLKDILYIYRDTVERKLVIQTTTNKFLVCMTMDEMLNRLDDRFRQIHRACIVNREQVNLYNWSKGYFLLKTGERVDFCSKSFKENVV